MLELNRCAWVSEHPLDIEHHDKEWGNPEKLDNDQYLFEMLTLESAQAGLSWLTILKKREGYRRCFLNYDLKKIRKFNETDIDRLMLDDSIIRNKLKIESVINNAHIFLNIQEKHGSFRNYMEHVLGVKLPIKNQWADISEVPSQTDESILLSKKMKKDGFKFFGPTICYAFMQSTGAVNDHTKNCFLY